MHAGLASHLNNSHVASGAQKGLVATMLPGLLSHRQFCFACAVHAILHAISAAR